MMQVGDAGPDELPAPGADARAHSERLVALIRERISAAGGALGFADYMNLALYAPGLGYYSAGACKFGPAGDFVTAPEVSPLFSRVLARQLAGLLESLDGGDILELGAGSGAMAAEMLAALDAAGTLPRRYRILEVSAELRARQRERIAERVPGLADRVHWLDALPDEPLRGVVVGNEVADALPVERFRREADGVSRMVVSATADGLALGWTPAPPALTAAVLDLETRLGRRLAPGYVSELSLGLPGWVADVAGALGEGFLLLADYGFGESEYYAPERSGGTFRCHYRHRAHDDALFWPGLQDLTAWVNFSALAHAGMAAGLELAGYTTQAHFLIAGGLEAELAGFESLDERRRLSLSAEVKTLTLPGEMGEAFRFMGFRRAGDPPLPRPPGFALSDLRRTL
jgi:SAM-dependent MidA family methyltransferase